MNPFRPISILASLSISTPPLFVGPTLQFFPILRLQLGTPGLSSGKEGELGTLSPHSSDPTVALLARVVEANPLFFDFSFTGPISYFHLLASLSWAFSGAIWPAPDVPTEPTACVSTADSPNRLRDKLKIEHDLGLTEIGDSSTKFRERGGAGRLVARGYLRMLYGDHGPYVEFSREQLVWECFVEHVLKGPRRHYHEHRTVPQRSSGLDGADAAGSPYSYGFVKLYEQFRGVCDEPNPPPGPYSVCCNRRDGYAPYLPGRFYISPDDLAVSGSPEAPT